MAQFEQLPIEETLAGRTAIDAVEKINELNTRFADGVMTLSDVAHVAWDYGKELARRAGAETPKVISLIVHSAPSDVWSIVERIVKVRFNEDDEENVSAAQIMQWILDETDKVGEFTACCLLFGMIVVDSDATREEVN